VLGEHICCCMQQPLASIRGGDTGDAPHIRIEKPFI